jgi:hypothetical protein
MQTLKPRLSISLQKLKAEPSLEPLPEENQTKEILTVDAKFKALDLESPTKI